MKLLALDTSSIACSVALACGDQLIERYEEQPREHTRLLLPMVRSLLEEADIQLASLDAIVLGNGPGSFIGMRIAASVAQGLAFGAGLGIVSVSSLAAVAAEALQASANAQVAVVQDAHMSEVYLGLYQAGTDGLPVAMAAERIHGMGPIAELAADNGGPWVAAGAGWDRYPQLYAANRAQLSARSDSLHPHARHLLPMGEALLQAGGVQSPATLEPAYLRDKVAEPPAPAS
jgi:tRNA threonylcarbamoyladenosine biosynthesis protein TsaB